MRASCQAVSTQRNLHLQAEIPLILLRQLAAAPQEAALAVHAGAGRPGVGRGRGDTGSFLPGTYRSGRQIWPATPRIAWDTLGASDSHNGTQEHRDPFDRMLVAQSSVEDVPLVSSDPALRGFGVTLVW